MKKVIALCLLALMALAGTAAFAAPAGCTMRVVITPTCADYNHVGDEWYEYYELNGYEMFRGDVIDFYVGDEFTLLSRMSEKDMFGNYDIGECIEAYRVDPTMIRNGFTIDQYLTVSEDSGVYRDYWCEWYIHFEFIPV